jgi:monofunctional biosynthetic peptidoglycan transglycosylase
LSNKKKVKRRGFFRRTLRIILKVFIYGFLLSIFYIFFCKWVNPPITITQIVSIFEGHKLHRSYVKMSEISPNMKLAVMAGEDQLFPDHNGFDFKSIQKARKHNQ